MRPPKELLQEAPRAPPVLTLKKLTKIPSVPLEMLEGSDGSTTVLRLSATQTSPLHIPKAFVVVAHD